MSYKNSKDKQNKKTDTFEVIKEKIFMIIHITLKNDNTSFITVSILCAINLMQLLSLPFNTIVNILFN